MSYQIKFIRILTPDSDTDLFVGGFLSDTGLLVDSQIYDLS